MANALTAVVDRAQDAESAPAGTTAPDAPAAQLVVTQRLAEAMRSPLADTLDRWSVNGTVPERPTAAEFQRPTPGAGSRFHPGVVPTCVDVFGTG